MIEKQLKKKLLQWHPAFYASLQIELAEEAAMLTFENEHLLSTKPMQIDVLIIKKQPDYTVKKNIGRIFRTHNIIEYKAPGDYISIDDYYKVFAYTYFYKSSTTHTNEITISNLTITFVCQKYPKTLFSHLTTERHLTINKVNTGIYYIQNDTLPVQILISSQLSDTENIWLKSLTKDLNNKDTINKLTEDYAHHKRDELYKSVMNIIVRANYEQFEEGQNMCEALSELWMDDIIAAKDEGRLEGALVATISTCQALGLNKEQTINIVVDKLGYNLEDSRQYVTDYWEE